MGYYNAAAGDFYKGHNRVPRLWGKLRRAPPFMQRSRVAAGDYYARVIGGDYYRPASVRGDFWSKAKKAVKKVAKTAGTAVANYYTGGLYSQVMPGGGSAPNALTAAGGPLALPGTPGPVDTASPPWYNGILGQTAIGKALNVYSSIQKAAPTGALADKFGLTAAVEKWGGLPNVSTIGTAYNYGSGEDTGPLRAPSSSGTPRRRKKKKCRARPKPFCPRKHKHRKTCKPKGRRVSFTDKKTGKRVSFIARK